MMNYMPIKKNKIELPKIDLNTLRHGHFGDKLLDLANSKLNYI